jgi:hypothetical protein
LNVRVADWSSTTGLARLDRAHVGAPNDAYWLMFVLSAPVWLGAPQVDLVGAQSGL